MVRPRVAIVLFNMGGPDRPEAISPFLCNLFSDPAILGLPWPVRPVLARWIAARRLGPARVSYAHLGGRSPLLGQTEEQGRLLASALPEIEARAFIAMRYWHPLTEEAISQIRGEQFEKLVLLPLYPHYSFATTGSSLKEWQRLYRSNGLPMRVINDFHDHPLYIAALAERVNEALASLASPADVHLIFSAHGLPLSLIEKGDPYPKQIEKTVELLRAAGEWSNPFTLCYQSRVGRQKWLEPSLTNTIEDLAAKGIRRVLVIPISFVTEHIETLHEINIEAREHAKALGIQEFHMMPALDDSPRFIEALADLVRAAAQ